LSASGADAECAAPAFRVAPCSITNLLYSLDLRKLSRAFFMNVHSIPPKKPSCSSQPSSSPSQIEWTTSLKDHRLPQKIAGRLALFTSRRELEISGLWPQASNQGGCLRVLKEPIVKEETACIVRARSGRAECLRRCRALFCFLSLFLLAGMCAQDLAPAL